MNLQRFLSYGMQFSLMTGRTGTNAAAVTLFEALWRCRADISTRAVSEARYDPVRSALRITRQELSTFAGKADSRMDLGDFYPGRNFMKAILRFIADDQQGKWLDGDEQIALKDREGDKMRQLGMPSYKKCQGVLLVCSDPVERGVFWFCIANDPEFLVAFQRAAKECKRSQHYHMASFPWEQQFSYLGLQDAFSPARQVSELPRTSYKPLAERWQLHIKYLVDTPKRRAAWNQINDLLVQQLRSVLKTPQNLTLLSTDLVRETTEVFGHVFFYWEMKEGSAAPILTMAGGYTETIPIKPVPLRVHWIICGTAGPITYREQRKSKRWLLDLKQYALWTELPLTTTVWLDQGNLRKGQALRIRYQKTVVAAATISNRVSLLGTGPKPDATAI